MGFFKTIWNFLLSDWGFPHDIYVNRPKEIHNEQDLHKIILEEKLAFLKDENRKLDDNLEKLFSLWKESHNDRVLLLDICHREGIHVPDELKLKKGVQV